MPQNPGFGVEQFINLLLAVLRFYMRHETEIKKFISPTHAESMDILVRDYASLENINPAGPNSVPNTEEL